MRMTFEIYNQITAKEADDKSIPSHIEARYVISPKHFSYLDDSMIDYILSKGMYYNSKLKNHDMSKVKPSKLSSKIYMSNLLNTLVAVFVGNDSEKLPIEILSDGEASFDERYCEFIEKYLSHSDKYIDYLGCILLFSEASKNEGLFRFLSNHLRSRLLSLVSDTAAAIYTRLIEERLDESLENAEAFEVQVDKLQIELSRKDKAILKLKKKAAEKFESDRTSERKTLKKELRSKDAIIKKLIEQLSDETSDSPMLLDIPNLKETIEASISKELSNIVSRLDSLDNSMSVKLSSIQESTDNLSVMYRSLPVSSNP